MQRRLLGRTVDIRCSNAPYPVTSDEVHHAGLGPVFSPWGCRILLSGLATIIVLCHCMSTLYPSALHPPASELRAPLCPSLYSLS